MEYLIYILCCMAYVFMWEFCFMDILTSYDKKHFYRGCAYTLCVGLIIFLFAIIIFPLVFANNLYYVMTKKS